MPSNNPYHPTPYVKLRHPDWSKNATIYQINTRHSRRKAPLAPPRRTCRG